jgi:hypothetical protein
MQAPKRISSRRKMVLWGAALLSAIPLLRWTFSAKKEKPSETIKMLTRDGKLVEVDKRYISVKKEKIEDEELRGWVKRN